MTDPDVITHTRLMEAATPTAAAALAESIVSAVVAFLVGSVGPSGAAEYLVRLAEEVENLTLTSGPGRGRP